MSTLHRRMMCVKLPAAAAHGPFRATCGRTPAAGGCVCMPSATSLPPTAAARPSRLYPHMPCWDFDAEGWPYYLKAPGAVARPTQQ